jgi:hypothetical protein
MQRPLHSRFRLSLAACALNMSLVSFRSPRAANASNSSLASKIILNSRTCLTSSRNGASGSDQLHPNS